MFLYVGLFNSFRTDFRLLFLVRDVGGVHFCSKTDEFSRRHRPGFALELAEDTFISVSYTHLTLPTIYSV